MRPVCFFVCVHRLEHLALMVDGPPEVVPLAFDLHEELVDVPLPLRVGAELLNTPFCGSAKRTSDRTCSTSSGPSHG